MTQSNEPDLELLLSKQRGILPPNLDEDFDREKNDDLESAPEANRTSEDQP